MNIALITEADQRTAEMVLVILGGAGFQRHSKHQWAIAGCDIEEAADSLSDVFLELQSLDVRVKEKLGSIHVTMQRSNPSEDKLSTVV